MTITNNRTKIYRDYFQSQPEILQVKIYGSRALGTFEPGSDIDFAIFTNCEKNLAGHILADLDELPTPYLFDVTNYNSLTNENLKEHIDTHGVVFYEKYTKSNQPR